MDADPIKPLSFPVPAENAPVKRRAVFSDSVAQSQSRHVRPADELQKEDWVDFTQLVDNSYADKAAAQLG